MQTGDGEDIAYAESSSGNAIEVGFYSAAHCARWHFISSSSDTIFRFQILQPCIAFSAISRGINSRRPIRNVRTHPFICSLTFGMVHLCRSVMNGPQRSVATARFSDHLTDPDHIDSGWRQSWPNAVSAV